jgi:cytochrome P450
VHLLANCWLPLVERPDEIERLAANPDWMPRAVEEMLRVAGVPRMVFRRAATGERLTLMLADANRDPEQFADPDRLDVSRAPAGQLSLGGWLHSCVGGPLIRMAIGVATAAWVPRFAAIEKNARVEWRGGPILRWPVDVLIRLKST